MENDTNVSSRYALQEWPVAGKAWTERETLRLTEILGVIPEREERTWSLWKYEEYGVNWYLAQRSDWSSRTFIQVYQLEVLLRKLIDAVVKDVKPGKKKHELNVNEPRLLETPWPEMMSLF